MTRVSALAIAVAASAACAKAAPMPDAQPELAAAPVCAPTVGTLSTGATANAIVGNHRLTLVATRGPQAGRTVTGTLDAQRTSGTAVITLSAVGAVAPGPVSASNRYPVAVLEWSSRKNGVITPEITLRFGTTTSPTGTQRIEGETMALFVNTIAASGFSGTWESSNGVSNETVGGHFCAR